MVGTADGVKITTLINNSPKYDSYLKGCFGVSFWLEVTAGEIRRRILFDVGPLAEPLIYNARMLGICLADVDMIVLSHSHFDHTAALADVLAAIGHPVPVFAHPDIFRTNFTLKPEYMNYGMVGNNRRANLEALGAQLVLTRSPVELLPGLMLTGEVEHTARFEETGGVSCHMLDEQGNLIPDDLRDDISVLVNVRDRGLIILTGCAHAGPINTVRHAIRVSGVSRIAGIMGGFHLLEAGQTRVDQTIDALQQVSPGWVAPMHCTGVIPTAKIAMAMPGSYRENNAGDVITCP